MTMALDVVACLGLATDDARAMNFAGLCCLVSGSVIAAAPRAIRKGRRLSGMLDELGGRRIHSGAQNGPAPTKMIIHLEGAHAFCVSIFAELSTFLRSRGSDLPLSLRVLVSSRMEEIELRGPFSRRLLPFPSLPAAVAGVVNEREFLHS
jgi:hypothetical protein